ncbi:MAG: AbrB/MazE/SpoVT family DNA-binding domain-containing protein [Thiothrix sp.]|nr:MAG: AbrB/MazE/SpoVT family DNA-binding domain-containing protein [Thiothrix sp.]
MITTQVFKTGNSLALRLPKQLAFAQEGEQVEMEIVGNELRVRLKQPRRLTQIAQKFQAFSSDFMAQDRDQEQNERESL